MVNKSLMELSSFDTLQTHKACCWGGYCVFIRSTPHSGQGDEFICQGERCHEGVADTVVLDNMTMASLSPASIRGPEGEAASCSK